MPTYADANRTSTSNAPPAADSASSAARTDLSGRGYAEQTRMLSPRGGDVQLKEEGGDKPKFDQFKLTEPVKALFMELRTANAKRTEAIMNELRKTHNVPKGTIEAIIEANKPWYGTTWGAIKGGSWHTVGTAEDGTITHEFKLDGKGIGWENASHKVEGDWKDGGGIKYTNKDNNWDVEGGYRNDRGVVNVGHGTKEEGRHEYHAEGGADGGAASYRHTEGDESHYGRAGYDNKDGTHSASGQYTHTEGKESTDIKAAAHTGTKTGGDASVAIKREGYDLTASADGSRTVTDAATVDTGGASVKYTHRPEKEEGADKAPPPVTVDVTARVKDTEKTNGDESTNVTIGGGVKTGSTTARGNYSGETGTTDGKGYKVDKFDANFTRKFEIDPKKAETFTLGLGGYLRLSDKTGEESTYRGTLTGSWGSGKKDDKRELKFNLTGGHEKLGDFAGLAYAPTSMLGDDKGYGNFGQAGLTYGAGKSQYSLDMAGGATDRTSLLGGHAGYKYDKHSVDFYATMAKQDEEVSSLFRLTSSVALSENLTLSSGGSLMMKPGDAGYDQIWSAYTGVGIGLKKGMSLTLKMGVAGTGESIYYVPEAMYEWKDKFSVSALASIRSSDDYAVGAKLNIPKANLSIVGGVGDPSRLANPYMYNPGLNMGTMSGDKYMGAGGAPGGYIGVTWDALPTLRKLFGGK